MLTLLLGSLALAAPPETLIPAARLRAGEELIYVGDILDQSLRPKQLWKRSTHIEVRLFVLGQSEGITDLAILTSLQARDNAGMKQVAETVNGALKEIVARTAAVRLELIRIDAAGAVAWLRPVPQAPPLSLTAQTALTPLPRLPLDAASDFELGVFPPRASVGGDGGWKQADSGRPAVHWKAKPPLVLDGADVVEFTGVQESEDWVRPNAFAKPWRRTERIWLGPADGIARVLWRRIETNDGPAPATRLETRLDLQSTIHHRDEGRVRREIESAWWFGHQAAEATFEQRAALAVRIRRYCEDYPATSFRDAVEAVARRCEAVQ